MNWFTKSVVSALPLEKKKALVETWGGCDHVQADAGCLDVVSYENDSFGREGWCSCKACHIEVMAREDAEITNCNWCPAKTPRGQMRAFRNYDDEKSVESRLFCVYCVKTPRFSQMIKNDALELERELEHHRQVMGDYDD